MILDEKQRLKKTVKILKIISYCAAGLVLAFLAFILISRSFSLLKLLPILILLIIVFVSGADRAAKNLDQMWWCDSCNRKNKGKAKFCCGCGKPKG